ncbi:hypothetical protein Tco_0261836 [Tanacetum coccineum]
MISDSHVGAGSIMVLEIDTTPSSPTLVTLAAVVLDEEEREVIGRPQLTIPLNPTSNITSNSHTHFGMATHFNYSSEDVDEERELEAPPGFRPQPLKETEGQTMQGIPPLLVAHLQETERMRRTLSPREASVAHISPVHGANNLSQQLHTIGGGTDGRHGGTNPMGNSVYPPNNMYPPNNAYPPNGAYPPNNMYPSNNVYPPNGTYSLRNLSPRIASTLLE